MKEQLFLGIDIGSSATKIIAIDMDKNITGRSVVQLGTGTGGVEKAIQALFDSLSIAHNDILYTVATGYGRMTCKLADMQVSEISCHAKGVHHVLPDVRTIIDIGGQDTKTISINEKGNIMQFAMNDKCAAGTGRFLDVMSKVLDIGLDQMGAVDNRHEKVIPISNTCTVFAESEVISQLAQGEKIPDVLAGIHQAVAKRVAGLTLRNPIVDDVALTGGVAQNGGIIRALSEELKRDILIPQDPQITGALGAALYAREKYLDKVQ